jgi:hypothetical protein
MKYVHTFDFIASPSEENADLGLWQILIIFNYLKIVLLKQFS